MARPSQNGRLILVGGGARSGKSRFALGLARARGAHPVFIATAEALDAEMSARIERHREERGVAFETIEEPVALGEAVARAQADGRGDVVLVDCLTLWVSNLLVRGAGPLDVAAAFDRLAAVLAERRAHVILVSNEVGMGLVPETPLGRSFRDHVGVLHQILAATADEIYVGVMGTMLRLRPAPIVVAPAVEAVRAAGDDAAPAEGRR